MPWSPLPTRDGTGGPEPKPLSAALDAVMAGLGGPTVEAIVVIHEQWADIVGAEVAPHSKPLGVEGGHLKISVDGPGWASHLRWSEGEIVARLAALIGPGQVSSVGIRVGHR
ncbi:MAG: hypothetical protein JWM47_150 [Acidimicrobiales bacterium]|nr:hypothetical protein [Acidimicrobiales bacterium]